MTWIKRDNCNTPEEVFLRNIGVPSLDVVNQWFLKSYRYEYAIKGLTDSVRLIKSYKYKHIRVCGDYDVDGTGAVSELMLTFSWLGYENVSFRIPRRFSEGFGINENMIGEIPDDDTLIICVDNGLAQVEVIEKAKKRGMKVIILDHHEPLMDENGNVIKNPADIIIDPTAFPEMADYNGYCGAGLAYRLCCELLEHDKTKTRKLLCIAAIATICDQMELKEENRVFVYNGLKYMLQPSVCPQGLYALLTTFGLTDAIDEQDIGFTIGPAINSSSRMEDNGANDVVELLTNETDYVKARQIATLLKDRNTKRKELQAEAISLAVEMIEDGGLQNKVPLCLYLPNTHEGVIGPVCGEIAERYKVPVVIVTDVKEGLVRGSARTAGNFNVKEALDGVQKYLIKYGGHVGAAGLMLKKKDFKQFAEEIQKNVEVYILDEGSDIHPFDLEVDADDVPAFIPVVSKFAPFGLGNPEMVLKINGFKPLQKYGKFVSMLAAKGVKLYNQGSEAISFSAKDKTLETVQDGSAVTLIGTVKHHYWNGNVTNQITYSDII